jgi:hypothetical protein
MPRYDLHSHSTHSDGTLSPTALVARAKVQGVDVLALTDHDEVSGLAEARAAARDAGIGFVCGTEVSVTWERTTIHVLGLGIDPECTELTEGLAGIRAGRSERARRIGVALADAGIKDAHAGALRFVTSERLISRTHFARFLVEAGHVREMKDVFKRYLGKGKPGYVPHQWATLSEAVGWIRAAGGQAALAHPGRYKLGTTRMAELLAAFRDEGGAALEVLSPSHTTEQCAAFAAHARNLGLRGSCGSDFHGPGESWLDLGRLPPLPAGVEPVWADW